MNQLTWLWIGLRARVLGHLHRLAVMRHLRRLELRHVWNNFFGHYALTPTNDIVFLADYALSPHEGVASPERVEDPHARRVTYIWAALRYPDLAHLMPQREPGDPMCPDCGGSGALPPFSKEVGPEGLPCWCAGLGWLPDGVGIMELQ